MFRIDTIEDARSVLDAFGPCSVAFECMRPEDVLQEMRDDQLTAAEWVVLQVDLEQIRHERELENMSSGLDRVRSAQAFATRTEATRDRLAALGFPETTR